MAAQTIPLAKMSDVGAVTEKSLTQVLTDMGLTHRAVSGGGAYDPREILKGETIIAKMNASDAWKAVNDAAIAKAAGQS